MHDGRAGVASQQTGVVVVRHKSPNRCSSLVLTVGDVKYLNRVRLYAAVEREGNPTERRGEFLVRGARHQQ